VKRKLQILEAGLMELNRKLSLLKGDDCEEEIIWLCKMKHRIQMCIEELQKSENETEDINEL